MSTAAWIDEEDENIRKQLPPFIVEKQERTPSWIVPPADYSRKRLRHEELEDALASTAPLLLSKHQKSEVAAPRIASTFVLPRDMGRCVRWHPNSQVAVVSGSTKLYAFHASGKYVECMMQYDTKQQLSHFALTSDGDTAVVVPRDGYIPFLFHLTEERTTRLDFLDTRENFVYRHNHKRSTITEKQSNFITKIATRDNDTLRQLLAVANGQQVRLASLSAGTVVSHLALSDPVVDCAFTSLHELSVVLPTKVAFYDLRKTATFVREMLDDGSVGTSCIGYSSTHIALGSTSGVVNIYSRGQVAPLKVLKNLTTAINCISFGQGCKGACIAVSTPSQKAGFRLVSLPSCAVVPSFPDVASRHQFVHCVAFAPAAPVLSVGERGRVSNYLV